MKTDLSLVLSQLPSCWQRSLTVHLSLNKEIGIYPSDCWSYVFAQNSPLSTFSFLSMQFERDCAIFFSFFLLFPYLSFLASKNFCSQENFTQRLTNDAKSYGKRKRVATFA